MARIKTENVIFPNAGDTENCNGCAVCTLSCPIWNQTHDILMTFCGRMRSIQGGAVPEDLKDSLNACVLCGSCEPTCSFDIDTVAKTIELKAALNKSEPDPRTTANRQKHKTASGRILLANSLLLGQGDILEKILELLGQSLTLGSDNGEDISYALEKGEVLSKDRINDFLGYVGNAVEVITTDGLIYRIIRRLLPGTNVLGLGEALIRHTGLQGKIDKSCVYIIDSGTYNSDFKRKAEMYDRIRQETGCMMNLDLHRVATPTGMTLHDQNMTRMVVDPVKQAEWILNGRFAQKIIVENLQDIEPFRQASDLPVAFVAEMF
jgi:NAD-dependent dihydropyrimidine dehydrogenase PreA subunit